MNDPTTAEVVFDAQVSVACTLYRILNESQGWTPNSPSRVLYDQTRRDLAAQLVGRLETLVPADVIRAAQACES